MRFSAYLNGLLLVALGLVTAMQRPTRTSKPPSRIRRFLVPRGSSSGYSTGLPGIDCFPDQYPDGIPCDDPQCQPDQSVCKGDTWKECSCLDPPSPQVVAGDQSTLSRTDFDNMLRLPQAALEQDGGVEGDGDENIAGDDGEDGEDDAGDACELEIVPSSSGSIRPPPVVTGDPLKVDILPGPGTMSGWDISAASAPISSGVPAGPFPSGFVPKKRALKRVRQAHHGV